MCKIMGIVGSKLPSCFRKRILKNQNNTEINKTKLTYLKCWSQTEILHSGSLGKKRRNRLTMD